MAQERFKVKNQKYTLDDILTLIASNTRSNNHLDFYLSEYLIPGNDKKEFWLSKCISAFANTGGGTVFFGIKTYRGRAKEIVPVDFSIININWLENILSHEIYPGIDKLDIYKVILNEFSDKGIIVIRIPNSTLRPHMASDKRYYERISLKEEVMSEHRVRELYNKVSLPQMEFLGIMNRNGVATLDNGKLLNVTFYPKFLIRNSGTGIEKNLKFELWIPSVFHDANFSALQNYFNRLEGSYSVFSFSNKNVIFQEEICTIAEAKLSVDFAKFNEFSEGKLIIKLYHSGGMKEMEFQLNETFTIDNKILEECNFSSNILK